MFAMGDNHVIEQTLEISRTTSGKAYIFSGLARIINLQSFSVHKPGEN
jgi:hypothetical protein